jgi:hypothetical protein
MLANKITHYDLKQGDRVWLGDPYDTFAEIYIPLWRTDESGGPCGWAVAELIEYSDLKIIKLCRPINEQT